MNVFQETIRKVQSEEMLSRFRSKEDIYKYMSIQMGLFLPSFQGTKLSFIRAILSNQKKVLRSQDVLLTKVPQFEELSVKNLYPDAMNDEIIKQYLPELEMNSNRLPERNFFFGILGTLKHEYLMKIIQDAQKIRYSINQTNDQDNNFIIIENNWYNELIQHPYISKKPGKAIHLIKQRSKLIRNKKAHNRFQLSQRLNQSQEQFEEGELDNFEKSSKRQKVHASLQSQSNLSLEDHNQIMQFNI